MGWIGVSLLALLLLDGYRRAVKAYRRNPGIGGLLIAYVLGAVIYSITEAGFRMLAAIWIFLLLAIIEASSIALAPESLDAPGGQACQLSARTLFALKPAG